MKKKLPRSIRKYIRGEKARIRREVFDLGVEKDLIRELYERFLPKEKKKGDEASHDRRRREGKEHKAIREKTTSPQRKKRVGEKKKLKVLPKTQIKSKTKVSSRPKKVNKKKAPEDS